MTEKDFSSLDEADKKKNIKKKISHELEQKLQMYLKRVIVYNYETAFEDFMEWLNNQS